MKKSYNKVSTLVCPQRHPGGESIMKLSIGEILKSLVFGFTAGLVAAIFLLSIGDNTDEVIYGASVPMTRFFVTVVSAVACITAEMTANTSAREVGVDICICWIVSLMFVDKGFLDSADKVASIKNMMGPIFVSVGIAAFFSDPIQRVGVKILDWIPFKKSEE